MNSFDTLEFTAILERLCECAVSDAAREQLLALKPSLSEAACRRNMEQTTEAKTILTHFGTPPLAAMKELDKLMELCAKGAMLTPEQLQSVEQFLFTCKRMKLYLKKAESLELGTAYFGGAIDPLDSLYAEIDKAIRGDRVDDSASPALRDISRKIETLNAQVKAKLESLLRGKKDWFSDSYVATRNGHFVLPVKKEHRNQVSGSVIESSSSGSTLFIEPASVAKSVGELSTLQIAYENETRRILYTLTAAVDDARESIHANREVMQELDVLFAKAKLSQQMKAVPVAVTAQRRMVLKAAHHPLLKQVDCVPLDFAIGDGVRGVVITGPNTGGKTVALKTVGLLSLMAQSGLHVPVAEGSELCLHNLILCDIGDGQSISENLSTFSAHMTHIIEILAEATSESLVLLDELGSGTDPAEGMGIATAVLEELGRKGCLFVVTTHYPEIKEYAEKTPGLLNARMAFDRESLRPLYRLELGLAGESCALYIAKRLGFPQHLLEIAQAAACHRELPPSGQGLQAPESPHSAPKIQKEKPRQNERKCDAFQLGDCVLIYPQKQIGIVFQTADERGQVGVQIKKEKQFIPYKRLKLHVAAAELYPPDYDFSIVFDTVANRKARHTMERKHDENAVVQIEDGERQDG